MRHTSSPTASAESQSSVSLCTAWPCVSCGTDIQLRAGAENNNEDPADPHRISTSDHRTSSIRAISPVSPTSVPSEASFKRQLLYFITFLRRVHVCVRPVCVPVHPVFLNRYRSGFRCVRGEVWPLCHESRLRTSVQLTCALRLP